MKHKHLTSVISGLLISCSGSPSGCGGQALPDGGVPIDQKLEAGAQVRVTAAGMDRVTNVLKPVLTSALGGSGFCLPKTRALGVDICDTNHNGCSPGCNVEINLDYLDVDIVSSDTMRVAAQFDASTDVHVDAGIVGSCTFDVSTRDVGISADIKLVIDETTGELRLDVGDIDLDSIDVRVDGCGFIGDVVGGLVGFLGNFLSGPLGGFIIDLLDPILSDMVENLLPSPLGLESKMFVGEMIGSANHDVGLEVSTLVGGYGNFANDGVSIGMIMGFNADRNPNTRETGMASEPSRCVPARDAPDFLAAPWSLPTSTRGSATLPVEPIFSGASDPANTDFLMGISRSSLDLLGHHLISSGGLCIEFGTDSIEQLSLGALSVFLPSLGDIEEPDGDNPLRMVVRPLNPISFQIGDGTTASPHIQANISELQIDFYGYVYGRYIRLFSVGASLDLGVNIDFTTNMAGELVATPMIVGLDSKKIALRAYNGEFLREDVAVLEEIIPDLLDLALPQLGGALGSFTIPEVAGFGLNNLSVSRLQGQVDDFLVIGGAFSAGTTLKALAARYPVLAPQVEAMTPTAEPTVHAGTPTVMVAADRSHAIADVAYSDQLGRPIEWSYRIDNGGWHVYQGGPRITINAPRFKFPGQYNIQWRARVVGMPRTTSAAAMTKVVTERFEAVQLMNRRAPESAKPTEAKASGCDNSSGLVLPLIILVLGFAARRRLLLLITLTASACGGGSPQCKLDTDCTTVCKEEGANKIGTCFEGKCLCGDDVSYGLMGKYLSMDRATDGGIWLAAYNQTHGDLMVAQDPGPGRVPNPTWQFIDGVPDGPAIFPHSEIRGGIFEAGPDTGYFPSVAARSRDEVFITYFDKDKSSLMLAHGKEGVWTKQTLVAGGENNIVGERSKARIREDNGRLALAYTVRNVDADKESYELHYMAALSDVPTSSTDWLQVPIATEVGEGVVDDGRELSLDWARDADGNLSVAYSDGAQGLYLVRFDKAGSVFEAPLVFSEGDYASPSILFEGGQEQLAYFDRNRRRLLFGSANGSRDVVVDDGWRVEGKTSDGLDIPVFHAVGADAKLLGQNGELKIAYQDGTTHELRIATRAGESWTHKVVKGDEDPFIGGYGFYTNAAATAGSLIFANWVIDTPTQDNWVEILSDTVDIE